GNTYHLDPTGFIGGVQGGYNFQFDRLFLGVEADIDFSSASGTRRFNGGYDTYTSKLTSLATLPAPFGLALNHILVFGTGGIALAKLQDENKQSFGFDPDLSVGRGGSATGWVGGIGAEYAVNDVVSVKGEYLYADFGSKGDTYTPAPYRFDFN